MKIIDDIIIWNIRDYQTRIWGLSYQARITLGRYLESSGLNKKLANELSKLNKEVKNSAKIS